MDRKQIQGFLSALFDGKREEDYILIWDKSPKGVKSSRWFRRTGDAANHIMGMPSHDVYVQGVSSPHDFGPTSRCLARLASGIPGVRIDLDVAHDVHKKKDSLPKTDAEALSILKEIPDFLQPTIIIHSGHGFQMWWLFHEFWNFDTDVERNEAATLVNAWQKTMAAHMSGRGWTLDPCQSLGHVFRVPGTFNNKEEQLPVKIVGGSEARFSPEDFDEYIVGGDHSIEYSDATEERVGIVVRKGAMPPEHKLVALLDIDPKFAGSWRRSRKDLKDQSMSTYDASLTAIAILNGWGDQEVADLIIAFREKIFATGALKDADLRKAYRTDYLRRTIDTAKKMLVESNRTALTASDMRRALNLYEDAEAAPKPIMNEGEEECDDAAPAPPDLMAQARSAALDALSAYVSGPDKPTQVTALVSYRDGDKVEYVLHTDRGQVSLGSSDDMLSQAKLRGRIMTGLLTLPQKMKVQAFETIVSGFMRICEPAPDNEDATVEGAMLSWLQQYLEERRVATNVDDGVYYGRRPFLKDGVTHFFLNSFVTWLSSNGDRMGRNTISKILLQIGCGQSKDKHALEGGVVYSRTYTAPSALQQTWLKVNVTPHLVIAKKQDATESQ